MFHAGPAEFRSGWFVDSFATQTLVIFVIRTRRVPFTRSRPSATLVVAALSAVLIGAALPNSPLGHRLEFGHLPVGFFAALVGMIITYLVLVESAKHLFQRIEPATPPPVAPSSRPQRVQRRASKWSVATPLDDAVADVPRRGS